MHSGRHHQSNIVNLNQEIMAEITEITYARGMYKFFCLFILAFTLQTGLAAANDVYRIGIACLDTESCRIPEAEAVFTEAYSRIGMCVVFEYLPGLRDLEHLNMELTDATASRSVYAISQNPNLVAVPFPLSESTYVAFTSKPNHVHDTIDDYKGLSVGLLRGDLIVEKKLKDAGIDLHPLSGYNHAFKMLAAGRIDAVVVGKTVGLLFSNKFMINAHVSNPLFKSTQYHAIHKKHTKLAEPLAEAFRSMVEDGTTERLAGSFREMIHSGK